MSTKGAKPSELEVLRVRVRELEERADTPVHSVAEHILDNIMILDRDGRIQYINWTVPDLTRDRVLGTSPDIYVPPQYGGTIRKCLDLVRERNEPSRYEVEYVADDGSVSRWETRVTPVVRDGQVDGFALVSSNVTERREAVADREGFFALSPDLLCVVGHDGRFKRVNPAFSDVLGYAPEQVIGRSVESLVHEDDRASALEAVSELQRGGERHDFVVRLLAADGTNRRVSWRATSHVDLRLIYAIGRDITHQRELEAQLRQAQKMDALGQLAGGVAHDFNNLLVAIILNADLAVHLAKDTALEEPVSGIHGAANRAAELTKKLLAFSRKQPMSRGAVQLNELTTNLLDMLRRLISEDIELDFIPGRELPLVRADAGHIEQVIMNLCINARDAMPEGGRLTIETETVVINGAYRRTHPWAEPGRYVLLTVTDTGAGMTPEAQEHLFEPFFTTKPAGEGTGLGLATVYGIVKQHGGMIQVYSELGRGSSFKCYLPVTERNAANVGTKIEGAVVGGDETILVVEDAEVVRDAVMRLLKDAGYSVLLASSGEDAVRMAAAHEGPIHLALVDMILPKMSGPDTYASIRESHPEAQSLFTSGYGGRHIAGVKPHTLIAKPYQPDELLRRIRRALDE